MTRWFRFYDEALNDPKILKLPDSLFRIWVGILCVSSKNDGKLPPINDLALMIRSTPAKMASAVESLTKSGLIDDDGVSLSPHNWNGRQYKSDVSTERVKRFRKRHGNVSETPPDTEQIQKEEGTAKAVSSKYVFESGVIRLTKKDFEQWKDVFQHLDVPAELVAATQWASEQRSWFNAVKGFLAKKNRHVKAEKERLKEQGGFKWNGGIEGVI